MFTTNTIVRVAAVIFLISSTPLTAKENTMAARTPWGHPDLEGLWDFRSLTPLERPKQLADKPILTHAEATALREEIAAGLKGDQRGNADAAIDLEGSYNDFWFDYGDSDDSDVRSSLIVEPANGRLPSLTAAAKQRLAEQNATRSLPVRDMFSYSADVTVFRPEGPESLGLSERCLVGFNAGPPLVPSAYNNNLRIIQTPQHVLLVTEMIHNARIVPLDGRPRLPEEFRQWSGKARGWWEGESLVVETIGFTDKTPTFQLPATLANPLAGAVGSSKNLRLIERFTRHENGLTYRYTLEDDTTFEESFTVEIPMRVATGPMFEYACHEGNYAIGGILRGARLLESESLAEAGE
jgi:hypothetical protein